MGTKHCYARRANELRIPHYSRIKENQIGVYTMDIKRVTSIYIFGYRSFACNPYLGYQPMMAQHGIHQCVSKLVYASFC